MKRRAFTLIELLVALPLLMMLTTFLLKGYFQSLQSLKNLQSQHHLALTEHYFQRRLQKICDRIDLSKQKKEHLQAKMLSFTFDNGMSEDERIKGRVLTHLVLDEKTQDLKLVLTHQKQPIREECLLKEVQSIELKYYYEEKNKEANALPPFVVREAIDGPPQKWVAFELIINQKDASKNYFFALKRSRSSS